MKFRHATWSTDPIRAGVGLRQGGSASFVLFRWVLRDCLEPLHQEWQQIGRGGVLDARTLRMSLGRRYTDVGCIMRRLGCGYTRRHRERLGVQVGEMFCRRGLARGPTPRWGAVVQVAHEYTDEWNTIRKNCWAALHANSCLVGQIACLAQALNDADVLPSFELAASQPILEQSQLRLGAHYAVKDVSPGCQPLASSRGEFHQFLRRSSRWVDHLMQMAKVPHSFVLAAMGWTCSDGGRTRTKAWGSRGSTLARSIVPTNHESSPLVDERPERRRLGRTLRRCTTRRPFQSTCDSDLGSEGPWQSIAEQASLGLS